MKLPIQLALWLAIASPMFEASSAFYEGQTLAVLVFESESQYFKDLGEQAPSSLQLISCVDNSCDDLHDEVCRRVVAVVGQPHDISVLQRECFSRLQLVQSSSYMHAQLTDVPLRLTVATYQPDWHHVYGVEPIAEFILAGVFQWNYGLQAKAAQFAKCAWGSDAPSKCPAVSTMTRHNTLMGQTLGVLGYGNIGSSVARRASALGMRVIATRRHGPFSPLPPGLQWLSDDNDKLLKEADFVVTTVPGSVAGIINKTSLGLMRASAVLIPVSAPHADFDALYEALLRHEIGGAVLDVWPHGCWHFPDMACGPPYGAEAEPYATKPIQSLDNVLPLPSMAMRDNRFWVESATWVASNLEALLRGSPLRGIVRNGTNSTNTMWL